MRPNQQNNNNNNKNRQRGRNNNGGRKHINPLSRNFESNGPDVKVRGNAAHIAEKYLQLARDAQSSGDSVMAENYLQHAEHYFRIVLAAQPQKQFALDQFGQQARCATTTMIFRRSTIASPRPSRAAAVPRRRRAATATAVSPSGEPQPQDELAAEDRDGRDRFSRPARAKPRAASRPLPPAPRRARRAMRPAAATASAAAAATREGGAQAGDPASEPQPSGSCRRSSPRARRPVPPSAPTFRP